MNTAAVTPQIEGLPPGSILKPIPQQQLDPASIPGLPPGAILKPIGQQPAAPAPPPDPVANRPGMPSPPNPITQDDTGFAARTAEAVGAKAADVIPGMAKSIVGGQALAAYQGVKQGVDDYKKYGITGPPPDEMMNRAVGGAGINRGAVAEAARNRDWPTILAEGAVPIGLTLAGGRLMPKGAGKAAGEAVEGAAPTIQRGSIASRFATPAPGEEFSRQEIFKEAAKQGIPMTAAEARGSTPTGARLQTIADTSLIGGPMADARTAAVKSGLDTWYKGAQEHALPSEQIQGGDIGTHIQGQLDNALQMAKERSANDFGKVDRLTKGVAVDTTPIREWATEKLAATDSARSAAPSLDPKKATSILEDMSQLSDIAKRPSIDFATAQEVRSRLWKVGHVGSDIIPEQAQSWAREATGVLDQAMVDAADKTNPEAQQAFRDANEHWKRTVEVFNNPRSAVYQAMQEREPGRVAQKFLQSGSSGGPTSALKDYSDFVGDLRPLRRAFLQYLVEKNQNGQPQYGSMKNRLSNYSPKFLGQLFEPDDLSEIRRISRVAADTHVDANPSGTAKVTGLSADTSALTTAVLGHPVAAAVPLARGALAKALNSQSMAARSVGLRPGDIAKAMKR